MGYFVDKELYHHGIKGQRWGIRRFQNYDGTRIRKGSDPATSPVAKRGLTDEQKKALKIAAGVTAGLLVAYGGYKLATNPKAKALATNVLYGNKDKRLADLDKEIANMGPDIVKKNVGERGMPDFAPDYSDRLTEVSKVRNITKVNRDYLSMTGEEKQQLISSINSEDGKYNCQACTAAYDLFRKTGYVFSIRSDVDTARWEGREFMDKIYKDFPGFKSVGKSNSCKDFTDKLLKEVGTEGGYGRISVGGHAMSFYVQDKSIRIIESQNKLDLSPERFDARFGNVFDWNTAEFARTDNLEYSDTGIEFMGRLSERKKNAE